MTSLREFLLARIFEDETRAQQEIDRLTALPVSTKPTVEGDQPTSNPWRALSGCVSKRLIIAAHRDVGPGVDRLAGPDQTSRPHACATCGRYDEYAIDWPCYTLRALALDWVDHPDYRLEWRPERLAAARRRPERLETARMATL